MPKVRAYAIRATQDLRVGHVSHAQRERTRLWRGLRHALCVLPILSRQQPVFPQIIVYVIWDSRAQTVGLAFHVLQASIRLSLGRTHVRSVRLESTLRRVEQRLSILARTVV